MLKVLLCSLYVALQILNNIDKVPSGQVSRTGKFCSWSIAKNYFWLANAYRLKLICSWVSLNVHFIAKDLPWKRRGQGLQLCWLITKVSCCCHLIFSASVVHLSEKVWFYGHLAAESSIVTLISITSAIWCFVDYVHRAREQQVFLRTVGVAVPAGRREVQVPGAAGAAGQQ